MQRYIIVLLLVTTCTRLLYAQQILPRIYEYDNAGNRMVRKVIELPAPDYMYNNTASDSVGHIDSNYYIDNVQDYIIKIYPNPTSSLIYVDIEGDNADKNAILSVYNISGSLLFTKQITGNNTMVDLSSYPVGTYIVILQLKNNEKTTWKVIKK